jgi:hypothetical protein
MALACRQVGIRIRQIAQVFVVCSVCRPSKSPTIILGDIIHGTTRVAPNLHESVEAADEVIGAACA